MKKKELLVKYILGMLNTKERQQLDLWMKESPNNALYLEKLKKRNYSERYQEYKRSHPNFSVKQSGWKRVLMQAACWTIPMLVAFSLYLGLRSDKEIQIEPGTSKAILYLDPTTKIELGNSKEFEWIRLNRLDMVAEKQGILDYHQISSRQDIHQNNLLETPRGGEYRVILEDGTRIHLNSQSTLSYPVCFEADNRTVELTGEAYFEVAKDPKRPFMVKVNGVTVRQYGTKFSINARSPQNTMIVLEEGSIGMISPDEDVRMLNAGDVAVWDQVHSTISITAPESFEAYVAWHRSRFVFDDQSLGEIMENLSLWYDMNVQFEDEALSKIHFTGSVGRYENVNILLNAIEATSSVKFHIDEHQITVMNKY
ncbi:FecR family protein [Bacteroides sp. 1001136B_160425_E2]|uniref:FecR family protein n=1 Tax=Bacteroides sp. 1001136B_160425_E2 TaxID=2787083 RepID=UPI0018A08720|nr:FecR domain-containing protein [Bacteroides sp. 1001136B_160425_E2]